MKRLCNIFYRRHGDDWCAHCNSDMIFTDIMSMFVNAPIPLEYQKHPANMSDDELLSFQDWCSNNSMKSGQDSASLTIDAALEVYNTLMR